MTKKNASPGFNVIYGKRCRLQKNLLLRACTVGRCTAIIKLVETVWQKNNYGCFGFGMLANVEVSNSLQSLRWQRKDSSFGTGPKLWQEMSHLKATLK